MEIDSSKTALIVVDMQKGFCRPEGSLYSERSESVIQDIKKLLERFRDTDATIIFTKDIHERSFLTDNYDEFERWGRHLVRGSEGTEIVEELKPVNPRVEEYVVEKGTYDAFFETNMNQILRFNSIENVVVCGVLTNVCVMHTASSAALRDYMTVVVEDCTEALEEKHKEYALDHVSWLFGQVVSSDSIELD